MHRQHQHSPYSPASTHESKEFERFTVFYLSIGIPFSIALSYLFSFYLIDMSPAISASHLPLPASAVSRIVKLEAFDKISHYSYLGTIFAGILICIPTTCLFFYGYLKNVVAIDKNHPIDSRAIVGVLFGVLFIVFMVWFSFLFDFDIDHRPLGRGQMFLWPLFPAVGGFASFTASAVFYIVPAALYKSISQGRRRR